MVSIMIHIGMRRSRPDDSVFWKKTIPKPKDCAINPIKAPCSSKRTTRDGPDVSGLGTLPPVRLHCLRLGAPQKLGQNATTGQGVLIARHLGQHRVALSSDPCMWVGHLRAAP